MLRYKTIDECLRNNFHYTIRSEISGYWTLEELAQSCYESIGVKPSERTIKLDISRMRSGELGFEAPIENCYGIGYKYLNPSFSIYQSPLYKNEVEKIVSSLNLLKTFKGLSYFSHISKSIRQYTQQSIVQDYYQYDPIGIIRGFEFFDYIIKSIEQNNKVEIIYKPFIESNSFHLLFNPAFIKEYHQRWYLIGTNEANKVYNLAFDRMESIFPTSFECNVDRKVLMEKYSHVVGVSVPELGQLEEVIFEVEKDTIPYIQTKPLHSSQQFLEKKTNSGAFKIEVIPNIELMAALLSLGSKCKVLAPESLKITLKNEISKMQALYL